ncbi:hypothetical protein BDN72DRAFT_377456 [Pluteus cervinus]|uniref:Uncharacterized protein n=1 Tax=Pluteus cervinus TaxID=181527 RepID=A0ACD3AB01_9AGAR|nr:hypothetical protein BDN72DRAFT_377456 [Pluteus cervinus]
MIPSLLWLVPCSLAYTAWAQIIAECTNLPAAQWTFNSLGQSPCDVASALGGVCTGLYSVTPISPTQIYAGPTLALANTCLCSTAFYSMLSACAFCQFSAYESWDLFSFNCTSTNDGIGFPLPIPQGFAIPAYAYIDVTNPANGGTFNLTLAQADTAPESTAAPEPTASFATTTAAGNVPTDVPSTNSTSSNPNASAIAGGVIGAFFILLLAGAGLFFCRGKKKKTRSRKVQPASDVVQPDLTGESSTAPISYTSTSPFSPSFPAGNSGTGTRVNDASDPSTLPISPVPSSNTGLSGYNGGSSVEHQNLLAPSLIGSGAKHNYTGAPEVYHN